MEKSKKINFRVYPYYVGNDNISCDGSPYEDDWQLDENGQPFIVGQVNVDEQIQQYAKECDINNIVAQHIALGDIASLGVGADESKFIDVSNIPNDLNTLNQKRLEAYKTFKLLNPEQRALFSDFDDFMLNFSKLFVKNDDVKKEEVKENE